ncbi:hypothetical Protein YC6258_02788 [Gynuella sunshinyii YC6258]|uniref:DNA alkylation repair enzyme n=2 Tax=Gynuella sunshinyii TaxID=1445505 RepID=A0A0C5VKL8_9GAMM|nr:hypothetical Protein YC6258_02788 [Gynuella sunshinyii YC6258]
MSITQALERWDEKSADDISNIYHRYSQTDSFMPDLIELCGHARFEKGTTWLLKHHLEKQYPLDAHHITTLYKLAPKFESWEAKLHVLQSMPYMPIDQSEKSTVEFFLRDCLMDTNKFIRAWAYNGFYELAVQYPEHKDETRLFFEMAMKDEAPSVKARIRNILKKGF